MTFHMRFLTALTAIILGAISVQPLAAAEPSSMAGGSGTWGRIAVLRDKQPGADPVLTNQLVNILKKASYSVTLLNYDELADPTRFNAKNFDALLLVNSPEFPVALEGQLLNYLKDGGDLILLGGHAFSRPLWKQEDRWRTSAEIAKEVPKDKWPSGFSAEREIDFQAAFEDYDLYRLNGIVAVRNWGKTGQEQPHGQIRGDFAGIAAVGFPMPPESKFIPLLAAVDAQDRVVGCAGGIQINADGPYAHSNWALFGITTPAFYKSPAFKPVLLNALTKLAKGPAAESWVKEQYRRSKEHVVETAETEPPRVRLNRMTKRFEYPDGRPFFVIGCNYLGNLHRKYVADDPGEVEEDFRRMHQAGINTARIWGIDRFLEDRPAALLKACARKYKVYLIPVVGDHNGEPDKAQIQQRARRIAKLFLGEPMLLGYDLMNEPYFWELGKLKDEKGQRLWDRLKPPDQGWEQYEADAGLKSREHGSSFPGVHGPLPKPQNETQAQAFAAVDAIYATVIGWYSDAIREVDQETPLTVGYNTVWACMPANRRLDFVANHLYEDPTSYERVVQGLGTLDRLAAVWSDRPILIGEFGISGGQPINGQPLDADTIAVGEMASFLYPLAKGYAGAIKWSLYDFSRWNDVRQVTWIPRENRAEHLKQARFGLFYDDGTAAGGAKPLVACLRFLNRCLKSGLSDAEIEIRRSAMATGAGYVFRAKNALFVGDLSHSSPGLQFKSERPANVMLRWNDRKIAVMASRDTKLTLDPRRFVSTINPEQAQVSGHFGETARKQGALVIDLLAGETITVSSPE